MKWASERVAWVVLIAAMVGDLITTFVGLRIGLVEGNPLPHSLLQQYGFLSFLVLSAVALLIVFLGTQAISIMPTEKSVYGVLSCLYAFATIKGIAAVWNSYLIARVLF